MKLTRPPKKFLIHDIQYMEHVGNDDWQKPVFADPVTVKNVRVDNTPEYSVDADGLSLRYNALVFCYNGLSEPFPEFKTQSRIIFDGNEHTITRVVPVYEAYSDAIYSYELEVI